MSKLTYLGHLISDINNDVDIKLQKYNKINGVIKRHFGKQMSLNTKLR